MASVETTARRNPAAHGALGLDELLDFCKGFPHVALYVEAKDHREEKSEKPTVGARPKPPSLPRGPRDRPVLSTDRRFGLFDHGKRTAGGRSLSWSAKTGDPTGGLHFLILPVPRVQGVVRSGSEGGSRRGEVEGGKGGRVGAATAEAAAPTAPSPPPLPRSPPTPPTPATTHATKVRQRVYAHVEIVSDMEIACTAVQKLVRARIAQRAYEKARVAALKLQALARRRAPRQSFLLERKAAIRVQAEQRRRMAKREAEERRRVADATRKIQTWARGRLATCERGRLVAALLIQQWTRGRLAMLERRRLGAALAIQRWSRSRGS